MKLKPNIVYFENEMQQALWRNELLGQLSDGAWENSRPGDHWKAWDNAKDAINPERPGNTVRTAKRRGYNFVSLCSITCIQDRMLVQARLAIKYKDPELVRIYLELFDDLQDGCPFVGLPTYDGEYWDDLRAKLVPIMPFKNEIIEAAQNPNYTVKNLRKDLNAIRRILKTVL